MTGPAAEVLKLRAWALRVLSEGWSAPPAADPGAWRVFLRSERCAVALSTRTEGEAPPLLHAVATVELQRILSARAQLERLGREAEHRKLRVMVLKGGVPALEGTGPVDLSDIDVLAEPGRAADVARLLDEIGYRSGTQPSDAHLEARVTPEALHFEVHFGLREFPDPEAVWRGATVSRSPGLWRPAAIDHAWHVLVHSTVVHPFRRGALRDLLLIGGAAAALAPDRRAALAARVAEHAERARLGAALALADAIQHGAPGSDVFRADAALRAAFVVHGRPGDELGLLKPALAARAFSLLSGPTARRYYWRGVWRGGSVSPWRRVAAIEARWALAGRWLRRILRLVRAAVAEGPARRMAGVARRAAAQDPAIAEPRAADSGPGIP